MERKLKYNAKKDFLVDGGSLYRRADKLCPFRRRAIDELISLFRSTRRTQSKPAKTKLLRHELVEKSEILDQVNNIS